MTPDERHAQILIKVRNAERHFDSLTKGINTFFAETPYIVKQRNDPTTQTPTAYLEHFEETPPALMSIVGDLLHNLRSALDHLVYQLFLVAGGTEADGSRIQFLIAESHAKYNNYRSERLKDFLRPHALEAIDALRPYKGGNALLWKLNVLDNIDKHRVFLTAGSFLNDVDVASLTSPEMIHGFNSFSLRLRPAERLFPLKVGDVLFVGTPGLDISQVKFNFGIAFKETVAFGEGVAETLLEIMKEVENIINDFKPLLT